MPRNRLLLENVIMLFYEYSNGEVLEYNNQEDGFIISYINLNHISYFSEEPEELIHKLDYPLQISIHQLIHSYMFEFQKRTSFYFNLIIH